MGDLVDVPLLTVEAAIVVAMVEEQAAST